MHDADALNRSNAEAEFFERENAALRRLIAAQPSDPDTGAPFDTMCLAFAAGVDVADANDFLSAFIREIHDTTPYLGVMTFTVHNVTHRSGVIANVRFASTSTGWSHKRAIVMRAWHNADNEFSEKFDIPHFGVWYNITKESD